MVRKKSCKVVWSETATSQLKEIYRYIKKDSEAAARHVKSKILESTKILGTDSQVYQSDILKDNNRGNYRAYIVFSYRISYKIEDDYVLILRVRHTSREPLGH